MQLRKLQCCILNKTESPIFVLFCALFSKGNFLDFYCILAKLEHLKNSGQLV